MSVRNCSDIGEKLQVIMKRLMNNQNLLKLLYYTDKEPFKHPDLSKEQIKEDIYEKLIKIVPRVGPKETANSIVALRVAGGTLNDDNSEFKDILISIEVFTPLTQWIIRDDNLRPFLILGEIQKTLNNKIIDGLGKMRGGEFELDFLTEEVSAYFSTYKITTYD